MLGGNTGLESLGLTQDRIESLIVALDVFCYKGKVSIEDFVSLVTNMYNTADKLAVRLVYFPAHITKLRDRIDVLGKEIDQIEAKKQDALKDCGMTTRITSRVQCEQAFPSTDTKA